MKRYLSLGVIVSLMIIMVITLSIGTDNKVELKTISGNIKEMSDVSLVYTPAIKDLKKEEIYIGKDGIKSIEKNKYVIGRNYLDIDKEHSDFLKFVYSFSSNVFEDDNYIGYITSTMNFEVENDDRIYMKVVLKNKETKEIEEYKIPVYKSSKTQKFFKDHTISPSYSFMNDKKIYSINFSSDINSQYLNIIETDLKKQTSKFIKNVNLKDKSNGIEYFPAKMIFTNNNKIYMEMSEYSTKGRDHIFMIYDIKDNSLKESNKLENVEKRDFISNIVDYNIKDNELNILIKSSNYYQKYNLSKLVYTIEDDKIECKEEIDYKLKIDGSIDIGTYADNYYTNEDFEAGEYKNIKLIDDKIYYIYRKSKPIISKVGEKIIEINRNSPVNIKVFDTQRNKTVFEGEVINNDKDINSRLFLVKDNI